ncbi:MAG: hypothetical protein QOH84_1840 [Kribbellaceae bacterium]|nr:hypothetical protein [Kribbellaceae bacterium]
MTNVPRSVSSHSGNVLGWSLVAIDRAPSSTIEAVSQKAQSR